jgi:uncharacterized protein (DUF1778 family)
MKTGRPKLPAAAKKAQITGVRLRQNERELVEKAAARRSQSLSEWVRKTLISSAEEQIKSATQ